MDDELIPIDEIIDIDYTNKKGDAFFIRLQ